MQTIDLDNWYRRDTYEVFKDFDDPFFNICADVDVTATRLLCAAKKLSYFIVSYYAALKTVNAIPEFRYRIHGEDVVLYDAIGGSCPVLREDRSFAYGYFEYTSDFSCFLTSASQVIDDIKSGAPIDPKMEKDDLIYSSVIPWVSFRGFEHAKRYIHGHSIPKIVFGKVYEQNGRQLMPLSVSGHHALMDGIHVGEFFQNYEQHLAAPEKLIEAD